MSTPSPSTTPATWLGVVTQVVAPATLVGGFLFYYGYVFTRKQYEYFGIDVDTIGLSTRDYAMRSPAALVVPLVVLTAVTVALVALVHHLREAARELVEANPTTGPALVARRARRGIVAGVAVAAVGMGLVLSRGAWEDRLPALELVATVLVAVGAAACAVSLGHTRTRLPGVAAGVWAVVLAATLWSVSTTAEWFGAGQARVLADHLTLLPAVILDSPTNLHLPDDGLIPDVEDLCHPAGQELDTGCAALTDQPRYRYRGLYLLVQGPDAMFLVPGTWSPAATTLLVPDDAPVRIRFQFANFAS